jgi:3-deoxy-manno-octulosonate cytidylyltransferase (CMP-KDO synthetase)
MTLGSTYCVIPARYQSSRFPGKPLQRLLGKEMILWVAEACERAVGRHNVIVATDDSRIQATVEKSGFRVELTSSSAMTGTDRVAEVASRLGGTTVLNVQGDEPMVNHVDIASAAALHRKDPTFVVNGFIELGPQEDPQRTTIPKVVTDLDGRLLYISRTAIPGSKGTEAGPHEAQFSKQVCIYAFSPAQLRKFAVVQQKTPLEQSEDIEILRFLELGQPVKMFRTTSHSLAVDTPEDVAAVEKAMIASGFGA